MKKTVQKILYTLRYNLFRFYDRCVYFAFSSSQLKKQWSTQALEVLETKQNKTPKGSISRIYTLNLL